jgi:hypothetical protein
MTTKTKDAGVATDSAPAAGSVRTAQQWARDCGMNYSIIGDVITVDRYSLTMLVRDYDNLKAQKCSV